VTISVQIDFAASVDAGVSVRQVPPVTLKSDAFGPLNPAGSVSVTAFVWKLCTTNVFVFVDPIFTLPNA